MKTTWQLIILDRDGVINYDSDEYIKSVDEWQALPGSLAAIAQINQLNIPVVVCTNQSGVSRKLFTVDTLQAMHHKLSTELAEHGGHLDNIYACIHHPDDHCSCRKPMPGMYNQAAREFDAQAQHTLVIGDSLRDIQAAQAGGFKCALVRTGKGERTIAKDQGLDGIEVYNDLADVVAHLIAL